MFSYIRVLADFLMGTPVGAHMGISIGGSVGSAIVTVMVISFGSGSDKWLIAGTLGVITITLMAFCAMSLHDMKQIMEQDSP